MKKKIIITGSSGFIGSALVLKLHKKYDVIGIDRRAPPKSLIDIPNYIHYIMDICKLGKLTEANNPYAVIHLAANPGVRDSHENFEQVCKDNIFGTQQIIKRCVDDWKPEKLLLASSSSVYGDLGRNGEALYEDMFVSPRSPYGMSKLANEQMVETYNNCGLLKDINTTCLRFFTVYGPNQRNELAIRAFTDWMLRDKPITLYGDGSQKRDFTHIDDILSGIISILDYSDLYCPVYNIGSGFSISINDIIYKIATYLGKDVTINYQPRNMYDVDCTKADINLIRTHIEWEPKIKFDDGLKDQIEWQRSMMK